MTILEEKGSPSFFANTLVYGIGTLLLQAASVVLLPLYTRYLTTADFGILEILTRSGEVLVVVLLGNGINVAAFTFVCRAKTSDERAGVSAAIALVIWLGMALGLLLTVFASGLVGRMIGIQSRSLVVVGLAASISQLLPLLPLTMAQARVESVTYMAISIVTVLFRIAIVLFAVIYLRLGLWGVFGGTLVSSLIVGVVVTIREFRGRGFHPDLSQIPDILRFSWPFVPAGLCGFILNNGDRYFLLEYNGPAVVGVYSLGYRIATIVGMVAFAPLLKVWSAWLYRVYPRDDAAVAVGKAFTRIMLPYLFIGVGACLFTRDVILLFGTEAYVKSAAIVPPIVLAYGLIAAQAVMESAPDTEPESPPSIQE